MSALRAAIAASLLLLPSGARAQPEQGGRGMRLDYQRAAAAGSACPDEATFRQMVGVFSKGEDPFKTEAASSVRVTLDRSGPFYRATVAVIGPDGAQRGAAEEHTLRTCPEAAREAASSAYLVVAPALAAGPEKPAPSVPPVPPVVQGPGDGGAASSREPPVCVTSEPQAPCPLPPPPPPRWPMDLTVNLGAYVMMTSLLTADVAPGFALRAEGLGEIFSIALELRFVLPGRTFARERIDPTMPTFEQSFDLSQYTALIVPCVRWKYLVGCGVLQGGMFLIETGVESDFDAAVGVGPRLGFEVPFARRFAVFGFGEALFVPSLSNAAFTRVHPDFPDDPPANVRWEQSVVSGFFGVGLSVSFK